MLPDGFIKKEILEDLKNKKTLTIKMIMPLLLITPLAFSSLDIAMKAGGLMALVIFTGIFGSAVGFVKLKESKMLERIVNLPIPPWKITRDYIISNVIMDSTQMLIPFLLVLYSSTDNFQTAILSALALLSVMLVSNSLGVLVAFLSKSSGEVHLYSIIAVMLMVILSGVIITLPFHEFISWLLPFASFVHITAQLHTTDILSGLRDIIIPAVIWMLIPLSLSRRSFSK